MLHDLTDRAVHAFHYLTYLNIYYNCKKLHSLASYVHAQQVIIDFEASYRVCSTCSTLLVSYNYMVIQYCGPVSTNLLYCIVGLYTEYPFSRSPVSEFETSPGWHHWRPAESISKDEDKSNQKCDYSQALLEVDRRCKHWGLGFGLGGLFDITAVQHNSFFRKSK